MGANRGDSTEHRAAFKSPHENLQHERVLVAHRGRESCAGIPSSARRMVALPTGRMHSNGRLPRPCRAAPGLTVDSTLGMGMCPSAEPSGGVCSMGAAAGRLRPTGRAPMGTRSHARDRAAGPMPSCGTAGARGKGRGPRPSLGRPPFRPSEHIARGPSCPPPCGNPLA